MTILSRWPARFALLALSALLLSLAFAPPAQFYVAWISLVPWLMVILTCRSPITALLWGWLGGILFFSLNILWMWTATIPGAVAAVFYMAFFWGLAGAAIRLVGRSVLLVPVIWCAFEWLRGATLGGFPWLLVGHSQSNWITVCQVADTLGVYGISFTVLAVNVLAARFALAPRSGRALLRPAIAVALILVATVSYGLFRLGQNTLYPGPTVMVVQPNFRYLRGGIPTASRQELVEYHLGQTQVSLRTQEPDLVVWSETVMPPLNPEARQELRRASVGSFLDLTHRRIGDLAAMSHTAIVTGGYYVGGWAGEPKSRVAGDIRNSAFFYPPDGKQSPARYDKTELVPFAETMPFPGAPRWLQRAMMLLAAPSAKQPDTAGDANAPTVFEFPARAGTTSWKFITPICFENVDAPYIARLLRSPGGKRADFIVNLTNDGWFSELQHAQHLQAILFRAIENRVPIARCSNTGISGFVEPTGRFGLLRPSWTAGALTQTLTLDHRTTFYTRFGDAFAYFCVLVTVAAVAWCSVKSVRQRRVRPASPVQ